MPPKIDDPCIVHQSFFMRWTSNDSQTSIELDVLRRHVHNPDFEGAALSLLARCQLTTSSGQVLLDRYGTVSEWCTNEEPKGARHPHVTSKRMQRCMDLL